MYKSGIPAEYAGPTNVKLSNVRKAAQAPPKTATAMVGIKGSGPVGTDSRGGAFRGAIEDVKAARPVSVNDNVRTSNRVVQKWDRTDRDLHRMNTGQPYSRPASAPPRPNPDTRNTAARGSAIPRSSELQEGRMDMGAALSRMISRKVTHY